MKKTVFTVMLVLVVLFVFSSCATSTAVPPNATEQQLAQINAQNLEATATNTSTLTIIQIAGIISGFILGLAGSNI